MSTLGSHQQLMFPRGLEINHDLLKYIPDNVRRFEFVFDSEFSAKKVKIDRNGTRVRSLKLGRIISPDTIDYKLGSKRRHYFQYRIEKMTPVAEM